MGGRRGGRGEEVEGEEKERRRRKRKRGRRKSILAPGKKRQGTRKFEASLGCVVSSRQSQLHRETCP